MCGGKGSRLGAVGTVVHKSLLPFRGDTLLAGAIRQLASEGGVDEVLVVANHLADQLSDYLDAVSWFGLRGRVLKISAPGTAGALRMVGADLSRPFYYSHGNIALPNGTVAALASKWSPYLEVGTCAVSDNSVAPTHPHALIWEGWVKSFVDGYQQGAACSVGLCCFTPAIAGRLTPANDHLPVEVSLSSELGPESILAVNIGAKWAHVEELGFYSAMAWGGGGSQ